MMKKPASETKKRGRRAARTNWVSQVRKVKPQLNALTDAERQELLKEGLLMIERGSKGVPNARSA